MTSAELKSARLALGLTQGQLADACGVASYKTVQRWERGQRRIPRHAEMTVKRLWTKTAIEER